MLHTLTYMYLHSQTVCCMIRILAFGSTVNCRTLTWNTNNTKTLIYYNTRSAVHANKLSTVLHNNIDDLIAEHSVPSNVRKDIEPFLLVARYIMLLAIGLHNNNAVMDGFMDCNVTAIRGATLHLGRARK
jgi:hypothetical protein